MTGRPYEQLRGVSERLLTEAEQAASAGSFELELGTGGTHFSAGLRRIFATPPDVELTRELLLGRVHPEDRELVEKSFERGRRGEGAAARRLPDHAVRWGRARRPRPW